MQILDGKKIASSLRAEIKAQVAKLKIAPGLAVVLIGDDEASRVYVGRKEQACAEVGICFERHEFPGDITQGRVLQRISKLNNDPKVHGILVQLPLPKHLDTDEIIKSIDPLKDADGFHPENRRLLKEGKPRVVPPVFAAVWRLIKETKEDVKGRQAVIMGNSLTFTEPLKHVFKSHGIEVQSLVSHDAYQCYTQEADILVVAVGIPRLIKAADIKKGSTLIDVGFNRVGGKLVGDIETGSVKNKASYLSPVPGGVGPLTVAYLLKAVVELSKQN